MSAALTVLSPGLSLAPPITIGGVPLTQFAIPERIGFPTRTEIVSQNLPSGGAPQGQKQTQVLGVFADDIELEGWFQGPNALGDANTLAAIQAAQQPIALVAVGHNLSVLIRQFVPTPERGWIRYRLVLYVLPPPATAAAATGPVALGTQAQSDASSAQQALAAPGATTTPDATLQAAGLPNLATAQDAVTPALAGAAGGLSGTGQAAAGGLSSSANVHLALTQAQLAQGSISSGQTVLEGGIDQAGTLFEDGWTGSVSIGQQAAAAMGYTTGATGQLAGLMQADAYTSRLAANLGNAAPLAGATPSPAAPGAVATLP